MSCDELPILIEFALAFGVVGLALWELRSLRRAQREDDARDASRRDEPPR